MEKFGLSDFTFFEHPRKSSSKESQAIYLGYKKSGLKFQCLQFLPTNSKTSKHGHKTFSEKYFVIVGETEIEIDGKTKLLKKSIEVKKNQVHQLKTKGSACLLIIEVPGDYDHKDKFQEGISNNNPTSP